MEKLTLATRGSNTHKKTNNGPYKDFFICVVKLNWLQAIDCQNQERDLRNRETDSYMTFYVARMTSAYLPAGSLAPLFTTGRIAEISAPVSYFHQWPQK
jgi:hypothetical protein